MIPIVFNGCVYKGYFYCSETKRIFGRQGRPLKTLNHKTYKQITLITGTVPYNLNYEKLVKCMEEQYKLNYEKLVKCTEKQLKTV
jgi:hypothetical protein